MYKFVSLVFFLALISLQPSAYADTSLESNAQQSPEKMRIIASGGSITEIIYALGKQQFIVATDSTSMFPAAAASLPKLGYFRQLSTEGILGFQPTHLLGAQATGPESLPEQLRAAGINVHIFNERRDVAGLHQLINEIGQLLNASEKALALNQQITQQVAQLKAKASKRRLANDTRALAGGHDKITALFVMSDSDRGLTVAGGNTVPQALFDDTGVINAAQRLPDYKVMDNESILAANPDIIFVASHRVREPSALQRLCQHPALKATNAGRNCAISAMESSSALGLSPRYPQALQTVIERTAVFYVDQKQ
ncbi:ABC transporter substrate-binding protein [Paraglaciecola sp. 20A4]|uniref:heme/hemin ABC transporter substrate-binding protein n=1 Tax=Paraglaciecola sp. 20A4 TaxID=2687288 RepID=UPI001408BDE5|nr:ABC transporter substrate-binding protein [Paraglaciecola sp. 20A4]